MSMNTPKTFNIMILINTILYLFRNNMIVFWPSIIYYFTSIVSLRSSIFFSFKYFFRSIRNIFTTIRSFFCLTRTTLPIFFNIIFCFFYFSWRTSCWLFSILLLLHAASTKTGDTKINTLLRVLILSIPFSNTFWLSKFYLVIYSFIISTH